MYLIKSIFLVLISIYSPAGADGGLLEPDLAVREQVPSAEYRATVDLDVVLVVTSDRKIGRSICTAGSTHWCVSDWVN